jgi:apolipoprotein N-acyltransferase
MSTKEVIRNHPNTTGFFIIVSSFTVALCWLGFFFLLVNGSDGTGVLVVVPLLATITVWMTIRGRRRLRSVSTREPKHRFTSKKHQTVAHELPVKPAISKSLIVLTVYIAGLSWLGTIGIVSSGGSGAVSLLMVPVLATAGLLWALRLRQQTTSHAGDRSGRGPDAPAA